MYRWYVCVYIDMFIYIYIDIYIYILIYIYICIYVYTIASIVGSLGSQSQSHRRRNVPFSRFKVKISRSIPRGYQDRLTFYIWIVKPGRVPYVFLEPPLALVKVPRSLIVNAQNPSLMR